MMHGGGNSDPGIGAVKSANNAEPSAAEPLEPSTGTKGGPTKHAPGPGHHQVRSEGGVAAGCKELFHPYGKKAKL